MLKYIKPRKTWHYSNKFKVKVIQPSLFVGIQLNEIWDSFLNYLTPVAYANQAA